MAETMGQIIRRLRKERNLTQEELAEQLNITAQAVSRWESETGMPDISQIVPLANVFGVTTDVLFGMRNQNADAEVEHFIQAMEKKLCNRPENVSRYEHGLECCNAIQELLKVYPNHHRLLAYSLGNIVSLLDFYRCGEEMKNKSDEANAWENECIRQASIILNHCTDTKHLNNANWWLTILYEKKGEWDRAEEYAKKLPEFTGHADQGVELVHIYQNTKRTEDALRQCGKNIARTLDYLEHQLTMMGNTFWQVESYKEAYACYRLYSDIYDLMVGDREDEIPFYLYPDHGQCALTCMRLNRHDEAMDWLEKLLHHERIVAKNYNVVTTSKLPYFYRRELHYSKNSYDTKERLTPTLAWKVFDPIRDTDRFKAILADAEAFERGE